MRSEHNGLNGVVQHHNDVGGAAPNGHAAHDAATPSSGSQSTHNGHDMVELGSLPEAAALQQRRLSSASASTSAHMSSPHTLKSMPVGVAPSHGVDKTLVVAAGHADMVPVHSTVGGLQHEQPTGQPQQAIPASIWILCCISAALTCSSCVFNTALPIYMVGGCGFHLHRARAALPSEPFTALA